MDQAAQKFLLDLLVFVRVSRQAPIDTNQNYQFVGHNGARLGKMS